MCLWEEIQRVLFIPIHIHILALSPALLAPEFDPCLLFPVCLVVILYSINCPSVKTWELSHLFVTCFIMLQFDHESLTNCWVTDTSLIPFRITVCPSVYKTALIKLHDSQKKLEHTFWCKTWLCAHTNYRLNDSYHTWRNSKSLKYIKTSYIHTLLQQINNDRFTFGTLKDVNTHS